jgi:lambda repressor-like predicted transcriptional regulator
MSLLSFSDFLTEEVKEVSFVFGRFNPPTSGHEKLFDALKKNSKGAFRIYASFSEDSKKNPLSHKDKVKFLRKMFPKYARNIMADKDARNALEVCSKLYDQGFNKVTMVVGDDRLKEFNRLLNRYNGEKSRHGFYQFEDGINVVSAGQRDPDAEGVTGMSASKMRAAAAENDIATFSKGMPKGFKDVKDLFAAVRKGMGLKEQRAHVQLESVSDVREAYVDGELFSEGDKVVVKESQENATIVMTGANYLMLEFANGERKRTWLDNVELVEAKVRVNKIYHTSFQKTRPFSNPMWFAVNIKHAVDGWYVNAMDDHDSGFIYETKPKGELAQEDDAKVKTLFKDAKLNMSNYIVELVENPTPKEVLAMKETQLLIDNGYSGFVYSDYDPRDFDRDAPALLMFDAKKDTAPWKLIKDSTKIKESVEINEDKELTKSELDSIEKFADKLFAKVGIDVEFTRHFLDRVNDERNKKQITQSELIRLFKQAHKKHGKAIAKLGPDAQAVLNDIKTNINMPFVLVWNGKELEMVAKTVMRKKNFGTSDQKLQVESYGIGTDELVNAYKDDTPGQAKTGKSLKGFRAKMISKEEHMDEKLSDWLPDDKLWRSLDSLTHPKKYKKAVRFYLDMRKKSSGNIDNASKTMKKAAKVTGVDYRTLSQVFHKMIKKGELPKHLAFESTINNIAEDVGNAVKTTLKAKADKSGISYSILKTVFERGEAAWQSGHRAGTNPTQWGYARVNSFIAKKPGTWGKADKDLADKVRGKK